MKITFHGTSHELAVLSLLLTNSSNFIFYCGESFTPMESLVLFNEKSMVSIILVLLMKILMILVVTIIEFRENKLPFEPVFKILGIKGRNRCLTTWPKQLISGGLFPFGEINAHLEEIVIRAPLCGISKHAICLG